MNNLFRHLGKLIIGLVAVISVLLLVWLIIGFFVNDMPREYLKNVWQFLIAVGFVAIGSSIPAWRWRKEIWVDVLTHLSP